MGHTAGMHTQDRAAAIRYGEQMPAARVMINSPTTHGAIGFSTDLPPSMTLGCGSWGGNVTSDNISPLHLMDIKRVAFETKPVSTETVRRRKSAVSGTRVPAAAAAKTEPRRDRGHRRQFSEQENGREAAPSPPKPDARCSSGGKDRSFTRSRRRMRCKSRCRSRRSILSARTTCGGPLRAAKRYIFRKRRY